MMKTSEEKEQSDWSLEFQEIYIITCGELYEYTNQLVSHDSDKARELLIATYAEAFQRKNLLPSTELQRAWLKSLAESLAKSKMGVAKANIEAARALDKQRLVYKKKKNKNNKPMDITSVFLDIEDRIATMELSEVDSSINERTMPRIQIIFSWTLVMIAVTILVMGVVKVKQQLNLFREPFERTLPSSDASDTEGLRSKVENEKIKVGKKAVFLSDVGQVLYSLPLEEAGMALEPAENPEIQKQTGWTYYLPCPEREDTQLSEVAPSLYHTLYRIGGKNNEMEIVATEVEDYLLWNDSIYVSQYGRIQRISKEDIFEKQVPELYVEVKNDEIYLQDTLGKPLKMEANGNYIYEDRVFQMISNRIVSVAPAPRTRGNYSYYFKDAEGKKPKAIYRRLNGNEEVFATSDMGIDSFCIAGDWLYYSAYIRKGGSGAHYSEIYRKSLVSNDKAEKVREEFTGRIKQMYYSEGNNEIYANYIPRNWQNNHGVIAIITMSGQMSYLDDSILRESQETSGNDMLEFVMADDKQVYCYWMDCIWKKGEEPVAIWRRVLVLPNDTRIYIKE